MTDPFFLPALDESRQARRYLVHTSGGQTSGYMLRRIMDAHGGTLPAHAAAVFANTGKERLETLRFLATMGRRWGVEIHWIEYRYFADRAGTKREPKHEVERVNYRTASRKGEPFAAMIRAKGYLPNPVQRICTSELKVETAARYSRRILGWSKPWSILGLRRDETRRVGKSIYEGCRSMVPLYEAAITKEDVDRWWASQPFRLQLKPDEGNCDLCFLKGRGKLRRLIRDDPSRAEWWISQERVRQTGNYTRTEKKTTMQFSNRWSYSDLVRESTGLLPLGDDDEESLPCFCTD